MYRNRQQNQNKPRLRDMAAVFILTFIIALIFLPLVISAMEIEDIWRAGRMCDIYDICEAKQ